jgi:hypothetical protein
MTTAKFIEAHGDSSTWTAADFEAFEHIAETKDIVVPATDPAA